MSILDFPGHMVSVATPQPCCVGQHRQHVSECACVPEILYFQSRQQVEFELSSFTKLCAEGVKHQPPGDVAIT